ncbi:class I SAM-dependent methyltransferase [Parvibaculum sp. MBR-TMA-1.3b-4.2]
MRRSNCMNCGGGGLHSLIDLGLQPSGNHFISEADIPTEPVFPLEMLICSDCWQVQISEFPPQEMLFSDHPYVTGVNVPVVEHFRRMAADAVERLKLRPGDLVMDIGCNDGTLLGMFAAQGMTTMGIDPGKRVTDLARADGHVVGRCFFNRKTGEALETLGIRPKLITATAVFYHVPDLHDFIDGLDAVMDEETVFLVQGVNLLDLIENLEFDHFYHEHSCIHAIAPLEKLFAAHGMRLLDVEFCPIHGGSFVAYVGRDTHSMPTSPNVAAAIRREYDAGLSTLERYERFARDVRSNMDELKNLLERLKAEGKSVYGLGAPLKGSTLLNYCDIGPDLVPCLTEVNEFKIGKLAPGVHIPVVDERTLGEVPDYYLVLSWNFADYFIRKYADYLRAGGKFIIPVPRTRIVGAEALDGEIADG